MEVLSWARLTEELGVSYTRVVAWSEQPALTAAARGAVSEQAAQDDEHVSSDDEPDDDAEGGSGGEASNPNPCGGASAARPARRRSVLWRRHGVDVRAALNVDDLSSLEDQARAAAPGPRCAIVG